MPRTTTVHRRSPIVTSTVSSGRTSFAGFTRTPFTCTWPPATASVASPRVLKNRAAQSHLSTRTRSTSACSQTLGGCSGAEAQQLAHHRVEVAAAVVEREVALPVQRPLLLGPVPV